MIRAPPFPSTDHLKRDTGKEIGAIESQFVKIIAGTQSNLDLVRVQSAHVEQIDAGFQRLD